MAFYSAPHIKLLSRMVEILSCEFRLDEQCARTLQVSRL